MNKPHFKMESIGGEGTIFVFETCVHFLIRSSDWYKMRPAHRYLVNMAATVIRMEDAKTETREYTLEQFKLLAELLIQAEDNIPDAAFEAWKLWGGDGREFGVVHLDQEDGKRGDLLLGDDPNHVWMFWPWIDPAEYDSPILAPSHGVEGSDV